MIKKTLILCFLSVLFGVQAAFANAAPIVSAEDLHTVQGVPVEGLATAQDDDGDVLTFSITEKSIGSWECRSD